MAEEFYTLEKNLITGEEVKTPKTAEEIQEILARRAAWTEKEAAEQIAQIAKQADLDEVRGTKVTTALQILANDLAKLDVTTPKATDVAAAVLHNNRILTAVLKVLKHQLENS